MALVVFRSSRVGIGFETLQCSLDNSIRRQLHRCFKLAAKLLGISAYSDSKGSSKFTRHGRPPVAEAFMPACTRTCKMGNFGLFFQEFPMCKAFAMVSSEH